MKFLFGILPKFSIAVGVLCFLGASALQATKGEKSKRSLKVPEIVAGRIIFKLPKDALSESSNVRSSGRDRTLPDNVSKIVKKLIKHKKPLRTRRLFEQVGSAPPKRLRRSKLPIQISAPSDYVAIDLPSLGEDATLAQQRTMQMIQTLRDAGIEAYPDHKAFAFETDPHMPPASGAWGQNFYNQWGLDRVRAISAWEITRGRGQVVAVIDTGVDNAHPELLGQVIPGWDFVQNDNNPMDDNGHGTHVAGIVASLANNGVGIAGVAPEARILSIKVLDSRSDGSFSAIAEAIRFAADNEATVINLSLGGRIPIDQVPPFLSDALNYAHDLGVVIVAAAGNSNADVDQFSPANDPNVLRVSASDHNDLKAFFSNYGNISVAAPGGRGWKSRGYRFNRYE